MGPRLSFRRGAFEPGANLEPVQTSKHYKDQDGGADSEHVSFGGNGHPNRPHDQHGSGCRQPAGDIPVGITEDGSGADEGDSGHDRFDDADRVRSKHFMMESLLPVHNEGLAHFHEKHGRQANEHMGAEPGPFAGRLAFPTDNAPQT